MAMGSRLMRLREPIIMQEIYNMGYKVSFLVHELASKGGVYKVMSYLIYYYSIHSCIQCHDDVIIQ